MKRGGKTSKKIGDKLRAKSGRVRKKNEGKEGTG